MSLCKISLRVIVQKPEYESNDSAGKLSSRCKEE